MSLPDAIFKQALDNALDIVVITDVDDQDPGNGKILYVNEAFVNLFGYSREEVVGKSPRMLQGEQTDTKARNEIRIALQHGHPVHTEILNYSKSGKQYWIDLKMVPLYDESGNVAYFMFIERDLSDRKHREMQLYQDATMDRLTGLYNRHHAYQLSTQVLEQANRYQSQLCVVTFDIDYFKKVNDNYGHPTGDRVLKQLADVIKLQVRKSDIVGRVGGEEFFIMLPEIGQAGATLFAERIRIEVATFHWHDLGLNHPVTISLGVTEKKEDDTLEQLIYRADRALYKAKESGRNTVVVYEEMDENG